MKIKTKMINIRSASRGQTDDTESTVARSGESRVTVRMTGAERKRHRVRGLQTATNVVVAMRARRRVRGTKRALSSRSEAIRRGKSPVEDGMGNQ